MKLSFVAAAAMVLVAPAAAQAAVTFNGVCANSATATQAACTQLSGAYGNVATLTATNDATLKVKITAWQANQSTNAITSAFLGAYSGGFGVTGVQDIYQGEAGGNGTHQIDNVNGYTDFVMLQFSRAVHLEGLSLNLYSPYQDTDSSAYNGSGLTAASTWNGTINLAGYSNSASLWTNTAGSGTSGYRDIAVTGFSQVWLVSASMLTTDRDDGFKLSSIIVTPQAIATPEPATWAMMIIGFGGIGATLRRRRSSGAPQVA